MSTSMSDCPARIQLIVFMVCVRISVNNHVFYRSKKILWQCNCVTNSIFKIDLFNNAFSDRMLCDVRISHDARKHRLMNLICLTGTTNDVDIGNSSIFIAYLPHSAHVSFFLSLSQAAKN